MAKQNTANDQKDKELSTSSNDCFIIMPIAEVDGYDKGHFEKVYQDIFKVACDKAGFNAIRADEVKQTNLIHLDILQKLIDSPMAICDLSNRNPNVLFELGLRQAFDKPTVLVQENGTPKIFDISLLRYTEYRKELRYREVLEDQDSIAIALKSTKEATDKGEGVNSIVNLLSLSNPASLKDVTDNDSAKMLQIVMAEMNELRTDLRGMRRFNERNFLNERSLSEKERFSILRDSQSSFIAEELIKFTNLVRHNFSGNEIQNQYDKLVSLTINALDHSRNNSERVRLRNILNESEQIYSEYAASKSINNSIDLDK